MENHEIKRLLEAALAAREKSYSPFSDFSVGAALLAPDGKIFGGCNIECSGLSATCCAERTAIFKAVSEGYRHFEAIAVVGGKTDEPIQELCAPCGICRQVIAEFGELDSMLVILGTDPDHYELHTIGELLPLAFKRDDC